MAEHGWIKRTSTNTATLALIVVAVVLVNVLGALFYFRWDVTEGSLYTLSNGSVRILERMNEAKEDVEVKFYFSRSLKSVPVPFKMHAQRVEELLKEYTERSRGSLKLRVYDPKPDTEEEEWARKYGVAGLQLGDGDQLYFGAVFLRGKKEIPIPYFDPRKEEDLEYDVSQALSRVLRRTDPKVGVLSSFEVMGNPMQGGDSWAVVDELRKNYDVVSVANGATSIDEAISVLLVIHPKGLSDTVLYALDQFVLRGGQLLVFVDPMSRTDLQQAFQNQTAFQQGFQPSSDLMKLFGAWGVEYMPVRVVGDNRFATTVNLPNMGAVPYPLFMSVPESGLSKDSKITKDLKQILVAEGGYIELKKDSPSQLEPLISTSDQSGTQFAMGGQIDPASLMRQFRSDGKTRVVAGFVRGMFASAFPDGPPQSDKPGEVGGQHLLRAPEERTVLLVADVDMLADHNSVQSFQFAGRRVHQPINDNLNFVANAVELLVGGGDLVSIRSRGNFARPFTKLQEIQANAQKEWKAQEEELSGKLRDLQGRLSKLEGARVEGNRVVLSQQQNDEIRGFREEEVRVRKKLREVRKNLREDIERLGRNLIALNMLLMPLLIAGVGILVFFLRSKRARRRT